MHIPSKKHSKSDVYKTWNGIFIGYTDTTKHLRVWALETHQVLIASKPVINESKQDVDLFIENLILVPPKPLRLSTGEPKPQRKLRKKSCIENEVEQNGLANNDASTIGIISPRN